MFQDISINDDVMEVKGKSDNTNELPSRGWYPYHRFISYYLFLNNECVFFVVETPAEATIPALPTVSADSNNTVTPPLIDKSEYEESNTWPG